MLVTAHSLTGAFIGKEVGYPPLAFLLGFISHFILDAIPHNDGPDDAVVRGENEPMSSAQYAIVAADIALTIIVMIYFLNRGEATPGFIWGAIGAVLPDFVDNTPFWSTTVRKLPVFKQFHIFHHGLQKIKTPMWFGLLTQYAIAAVFFWLLFRVR